MAALAVTGFFLASPVRTMSMPSANFTVYHPPVGEKDVADQLDFLAVHLTQ